jgi:formiminotetrahydrofolate cyclodeaminase
MDAILDIENYIHAVASADPTPGGGSVASVVASLGAALGAMVTNFTIGKKKYAEFQKESEEILFQLNDQIRKFIDLAQKDINTYAVVSIAYAMPKESENEKLLRTNAISSASETALKVPFEIMKLSTKVSACLQKLSKFGNPNLDSDMVGAGLLIQAATETAFFCVHANLPFIKDQAKVSNIKANVQEMRILVQKDCQEITKTVSNRMKIE